MNITPSTLMMMMMMMMMIEITFLEGSVEKNCK
jgi:hypothetical protein